MFETPQSELKSLKALVREKMEGVLKLSVPIEVNISEGKNWLELEEERN
ncbi:MAG: hypothetical protein NTV07_02085 [Candidatus Omnitrophica bacterium]|nr:hypothetical protein [Candidatus Omnitrophota bacterium]